MSVELKIKSKHLSEEARIIRFEEKKLLKGYRWEIDQHKSVGNNEPLEPYESSNYIKYKSLNNHRRWDVRNENRATFLARAYLAGKAYKTAENKCHDQVVLYHYILPRVCEMANKYGPVESKLSKKWNNERKRYEYDPELWKQHTDNVKAWLES